MSSNVIGALRREAPERYHAPFHHVRTQQQGSICEAESSCQTSKLLVSSSDFPATRTMCSHFCCTLNAQHTVLGYKSLKVLRLQTRSDSQQTWPWMGECVRWRRGNRHALPRWDMAAPQSSALQMQAAGFSGFLGYKGQIN